jgi:hypothetical protein
MNIRNNKAGAPCGGLDLEAVETRRSILALSAALQPVAEAQLKRHKHLRSAVPRLMSVLDDIGLPQVTKCATANVTKSVTKMK